MEDKITTSQAAIKNGIILGLFFMVYGMILQLLDLDVKTLQYFGYVNYVILIVVIVLGHKAFKEGGDGFMTIGQGLGIGMIITAISSVMSSIFSYIYLYFIDDSMIAKLLDNQKDEMRAQGMSDEQIEQGIEMTGKFMTPELLPIIGIVSMLFIGLILAVIVSLFTKNVQKVDELR